MKKYICSLFLMLAACGGAGGGSGAPSPPLLPTPPSGIQGIESLTQVGQLTGAPPSINDTDLVNVLNTVNSILAGCC